MQFNVKSARIKISFTFFALILIILCCDNSKILVYSVLSSVIHELTHVVFILISGCKISEFTINFSGCRIERKNNKNTSNTKECLISLSAPIVNISTGAFSFIFFKNQLFGIINIVIGFFNLLPFFDFDGGRGLYYFLSSKKSERTIKNVLTLTSILSVILISFVSVRVFTEYPGTYSLIILNLYMLFRLFFSLRS